MRRWTLKTLGGYTTVLLLLNTAYIAAAASPTVFYMGSVLVHVVLGAVVAAVSLALLAKDREFRHTRLTRFSVAALVIALIFAAELMRRGNLLEVRWVLVAHIIAGAVAVAALVPLAWRLARHGANGARRFGAAYQMDVGGDTSQSG